MRYSIPLVLVVALAGASSLRAQFIQYSPPGDFQGPAESRERALERAMEQARWKMGRVLLNPWFGIRNLGYVETENTTNPDNADKDFNVSIGAGVDGYLPVGSDFIVGAYFRPEYVWWQDQEDRRRFNGRAGVGLFGDLGRIGVEASASRLDESRVFSRELEERVNQSTTQGRGELTVDLGKRVSWFVGAVIRQHESLDDDLVFSPELAELDREERNIRTGFGFHIRDSFRIGFGVEDTELEFDIMSDRDRSNSGDATFAELRYAGPLFTATGRIENRSLEPTGDSGFLPFDGETGRFDLGWRPVGPVQIEVFARSNLSFSIDAANSYYESDTSGIALRGAIGSKASVRFFYETGELGFRDLDEETLDRVDDLTGLGLDVAFDVGRFRVLVRASETEYESNTPGFDRTVTRVGANLDLGLFGDQGRGPWQ